MTKPRGLAALKISNPARFNEIVRKGGLNSPNNFKNNKALAKTAGRTGGLVKKNVQDT
jgi:general stress protein YciG